MHFGHEVFKIWGLFYEIIISILVHNAYCKYKPCILNSSCVLDKAFCGSFSIIQL